MRTGASDVSSRGFRGQRRPDTWLKQTRKTRLRRAFLETEFLEPRTLLATTPAVIPAATATGAAMNLSGLSSVTSDGNANSPTVVIDPYDSQKVFAVWGVDLSSLNPVPHTSAVVDGAYSNNGGTNWTPLGQQVAFPQLDVATINATPSTQYTQVTDPSVAFDAAGNVYVLTLQTSGATDGELYLTSFNFSGGAAFYNTAQPVYQWLGGADGATDPAMAVDTSLSDGHTNNVYIAWASVDTEPANPNPFNGPGFNPNRAELVVGTPSGSSIAFSGATTVDMSAQPSIFIGTLTSGSTLVTGVSIGTSGMVPGETITGNGVPFATPTLINTIPGSSTITLSAPATVTGNEILTAGSLDPQQSNPSSSGMQKNSHPQLVINQNAGGQITVAWSDFGSAAVNGGTDLLDSNLVQAGNTYGFSGTTGPIAPAVANTTPGNWGTAAVYAAGTSSNPADPVAIATLSSADNFSTDVNGDNIGDIVVADEYPQSGSGNIGVLENSGTGTFPTTSIYQAGTRPDSVALAAGIYPHNGSTAPVLDAAVANFLPGGLSTLANGLPPNVQGQFKLENQYSYSGASQTSVVVAAKFGNAVDAPSANDFVTVDQGSDTVTVFDPVTGILQQFTAADGLDNPIAVAVGNFGSGTTDIAVLNAGTGNNDSTVKIFLNTSTPAAISFNTSIPAIMLNANAVSMASGSFTGNASLLDLAVVTDNPGNDELLVLQNTSSGGAVSFVSRTVPNSDFPGQPVEGQQGVAAGILSGAGDHSIYQDIAVLYGLGGPTGESTVAVFQNIFPQVSFGFSRTLTAAGTDFDAGQTTPTAIALLNLTNSTTLHWQDIVVANNDDFDRDQFAGTVSVLQPAAPPTTTSPKPSDFTTTVSIPNVNALTGLTVSVDLTDQATVQNLSLVLKAPSGDQITLVQNQTDQLGTAHPGQGLASGNAIGQFGYAPGTPGTPGVAVGTIFDDNATRNIFDPSTTGTNGNSATDYIGYFRPEGSTFTDTLPLLGRADTLTNFLALEMSKGASLFNSTWTLEVTNFKSTSPSAGELNEFSLQFNTGMTASAPKTIADTLVLGSITNNYTRTAPSTPNGIGPGIVLAQDNTLGPDSPYQGRIYAAFVGYYNVTVGGVKNPSTNTDIFLSYLDPGSTSWSTPVQVNDDDAQVDGYSQANDDIGKGDEVTGRSQYQPEIAVDQATGTVVLDWRDARDDAANARVATYITTSIDGGATFSPQTYANPSDTAVDAITGQTEVLGPLPDNQSSGNPQRDSTFGYGNQMGLAVFNGQVYPIWAGNFNQGTYSAATNSIVGKPLNIMYRPMVIAAGPRILSSSMGPIPLAEAMSGTVSISVTFDRPVDPTTFLEGDVQVFFHDVFNGDPFVPLQVTGVTPVASSGSGPNNSFGYTQFTVTFNPAAAQPYEYTGTYSYLIFPDNGSGTAISAPIESYSGPLVNGVATPRPDEPDDQDANGMVDQNPLTTSLPASLTPYDVYAVPAPQPVRPVTFSTAASILSPPFNQNTLPLIVPGPQVLNTSVVLSPGSTGSVADNVITNGTTSALNLTFDRPMLTNTEPAGQTPTLGSFTAADVLQIMGPTGPVSGPWTVTPLDPVTQLPTTAASTTLFQIGFPLQQLSGTYTVQVAPTIEDASKYNYELDTNQNAGLAVLRGQGQTTTTVQYTSTGLPQPIPAPTGAIEGTVSSSITVPDSFTVQGDTTIPTISSGLIVQVSLTYPFDPDLSATLYYDLGGPSQVAVPLFSGVGNGIRTANFTNTVFDDNAATPIQSGSAPFFSTFNPQMPLSLFAGLNAAGTWTLVIQNATKANGGTGASGLLTSWSLSFQKPLPTSGLGEPNSDDINASFRIFTLAQTAALSSEAWTAVGPAAITGGSGQISAITVDPSDPSGNTVYVTAASGGIWKTTDFLTTNPNGPTYIPLTDFGPSSGIYINSITVFPRNNNTNDSIIIAATGSSTGGQNDGPTPGVGFLISQDGGATWNLYDSSDNVASNGNLLPIESASRNREFIGMTAYKVVVDPELTPTGQVIIYAAMSGTGTKGGIWRSEDSGKTWSQMLVGNATDVVLDADSGTVLDPTTGTEVSGNLQIVYAGIEGAGPDGPGVYMSPNQGTVWNLMSGTTGNPLIVDTLNGKDTNVNPLTSPSPNGVGGRIVLAVPQPVPQTTPGAVVENAIHSGWLYAAVSTPSGGFDGLFLTKDFGQNWTKLGLNTLPPVTANQQAIPTNDITQPAYPITYFTDGNSYLSLIADPTNPNIVYLGSSGGDNLKSDTGLIRIDATNVWDAHSLVAYDNFAADGGLLQQNTTAGPAPIDGIQYGAPAWLVPPFGIPDTTSYLDFIRNPEDPFVTNATLEVYNYDSFTNNGASVTWMPFDMPGTGDISGTGYQAAVALTDPTTGLPRLIFGNSQGVWSVLDNNGVMESSIGGPDGEALPATNRNGSLQITQFYDGAVQPSNAAAQIAGALFYGAAQDNGGPFSGANILTDGSLQWSVPAGDISEDLDSTAVAVDQQGPLGLHNGTVDQYWFPGTPPSGTSYTDFFQVNGIGQTFGLLQAGGGWPTPDPTNWPLTGVVNFAVDPVNGSDMAISSNTGAVFATDNNGATWFEIGTPTVFGSPGDNSLALAYGAPDPAAPDGIGNLGNFIYVGTSTGKIFVTQVGGGSGTSNNWVNISTGLDRSQVESIATDPSRGSHAVYAVTTQGVYFLPNSIPSATNVTPTWINITGTGTSNIHDLPYTIFGQTYNPLTDPNSITLNQAVTLSSIVADWEYTIPNSANDPAGAGYHPVLYVSGNSGVYQSIDDGLTWSLFPSTTLGAEAQGGNLPHVPVSSLSLSLGNINPSTGMPTLAGPYAPSNPTATPDPDLMLASTFGRGSFAINMAPIVFPNTVHIDPSSINGSGVVTTATPTFDGLSEITGFGNATRITIFDVTDNKIVGGFDPSNAASTNVAANWTNATGNFKITTYSGTSGFTTNGTKTVEIYATDNAGAVGNMVTLTFTLNATNVPPTTPPTLVTLELQPSEAVVVGGVTYTKTSTPAFIGVTDTNVLSVELLQVINGVPTSFNPQVITTNINSLTGAFTLQTLPPGFVDGTYTVEAKATNAIGSLDSAPVVFTVKTHGPTQVPTLELDPVDDSGIVGDNITNVHKPYFLGKFSAPIASGTLVEIFQADANGNPTGPVLRTATPASDGTFSIQLPQALVDGTTSLVAEAVDVLGNTGPTSTPLTVTIVTVGSDYSGNLDDYNNAPIVYQAPGSSVNQPIPSATTTSLNSALSITSQNPKATVASLTVQLNVTQPNLADLSAVLIGPDGKTTVTLFNAGNLSGANLAGTTFSDAATTSLANGSAPYAGTFLTADPKGLAQLAGQSVNGTWTLRLTDNVAGITGTLTNWSLAITPLAVTTPQTFPLLPGSLIPAASSLSSPLTITGQSASATVSSLSLQLNITDPNLANLSAVLIGPDGTTQVTLFNAGDLVGTNLVNTTFSDAATTSLSAGRSPYTGTFLTNDPKGLAQLTGQNVNGTWTLLVTNIATGQTGTLNSWSLLIKPAMTYSSISSPLTITGQSASATVGSITGVTLNLTAPNLAALSAVLIGPNGTTQVTLFNAGDLAGTTLVNTTFRDAATTSITGGTAPYTGTFKPTDPNGLAQLIGQSVNGTWMLKLTNAATGQTATLTSWTLSITPQATAPVTASAPPPILIPAPSSSLSSPLTITGQGASATVGNISVTLNITDPNLAKLSAVLIGPDGTTQVTLFNAGTLTGTSLAETYSDLTQLIGQSVNGTWTLRITDTATGQTGTLNSWSLAITPAAVTSTVSPASTIPAAPASLSSPLTITGQGASATVGNVSVVLNITDPILANLSAVLIAPDGMTQVTLFNAGNLSGANLAGTTFSDAATKSITSGTAPYTGTFLTVDPKGLAQLIGQSINGTWTLQVTNTATGQTGTLKSWSLTITPQTVTPAIPAPIPDASPSTLTSTLPVAGRGDALQIAALTAQLSITAPNLADLSAVLISPDGTTQVILFNAGDLSGSAMVNTTFSGSPLYPAITTGTAPYRDTFYVAGLSQFQNLPLIGTWTLRITNIAAGNTGTLVSWSLGLTPQLATPPQPAQAEGALFVRDTTSGQGLWYAQPTALSNVPIWFNNGQALGAATDIPLQGDFDGDGKTDLATYNPTTAVWTIDESTGGSFSFTFGTPESSTYQGSTPIVGNFEGPGATEIGVYNIITTATGQVGQWTISSLTSGAQTPIQFGLPGDIPVPGDYDGVGKDELAVYRPSTGQFIVYEGAGKPTEVITIPGLTPNASLVPVPAEYNNVLGLPYKIEAAVFNPSTGTYTIAGPSAVETVTFQAGDIPVPADYAGTGSIQPAVYRPSTEQFLGTGNTVIATFSNLSTATVVPVDAPLSYRVPSVSPTPGTQLVVTTPGTVTAGAGFSLTVTVETSSGAVDSTFNGPVTLALGTNPGGSSTILGLGVTPTAVVNGVATFSGLTLNNPGNGYTLKATAGGLTATTNSFNVASPTATATQLVVTTQPPGTVTTGAGFGLKVTVKTSSGAVDSTFNGTVTLALGTNPGGSSTSLGGTRTVTVVNGVATFSGLTLNNPGKGYTLKATAGNLAVTTNSFNVASPPPPPPLPVIIGESVLFTRKTNKKGKPVGSPILAGFEFDFSTPMNPVTTVNPANYLVDMDVIERVKGKLVKVLQPVGFTESFNSSNNSVELLVTGKPTFTRGGQITLVATPPNGIRSAAGVFLDGNNRGSGGDNGTFTILASAKGITHS